MSYSGDIYAFSLVRKHPHLETKVTILGNKVLTQSLFSTSLGLCWTVTIDHTTVCEGSIGISWTFNEKPRPEWRPASVLCPK